MEDEKDWDKNFNWFDKEHYERFELAAGSREALLEIFHKVILIQHPNRLYGTCLKNIYQDGEEWKATVSRFKTKELCEKHCLYPPFYVRTGIKGP